MSGGGVSTPYTSLFMFSLCEGSRRSGAIRMQNALENASVVAGEGVSSRTGVTVSLLGMYIRGKTLRRRRRRRRGRRFFILAC